MKVKRFLSGGAMVLVLAFLAVTAGASSPAAPAAGPCSPATAGSYDPACDVNRIGGIDIADVQLVASHWNRPGVWQGDNDHDHLGQNWTGSDNPLGISGSFAGPDYAPLVLGNSYGLGHGLLITSTGLSGVQIDAAGEDGVYVHTAGSVGQTTQSGDANGFEVAGAQGNGLFVGRAGQNGVEVNWASSDGIHVSDAGDDGMQIGGGTDFPLYGVFVPEPGTDFSTLIVNTAQGAGEWALTTPDKIQAQNVTVSSYTLLAVVAEGQLLQAGDLVSAAGMVDPLPGSLRPMALVRLAGAEEPGVVGVVESRMARQPAPGKDGVAVLHSVAGPARPGDTVALTVLGVAQVRVDPGSDVEPGHRLVAATTPGRARPLHTVTVDGVRLAEDAPPVGVALAEVDRSTGLVWALVTLR